MLATRVLYYGKEEALPRRIPLRAGPLTLFYEEGDLRTVKWGEHEVLRRIYVAIRDRDWGTVLPVLSNVQMDIQLDHFGITFSVANQAGPINFAWQGTIIGSPDGVLTYSMDGIARSTFVRSRIGFCILHPAECAGTACRITDVDGREKEAVLPTLIQPQQPLAPFAEMAGLAHEVEPGVWAELRLRGDIFEMEDQRNWTDASFKTFCTPLRLPYPVEVAQGTRIEQSVELRIIDERPQPLTVTADAAGSEGGETAPLLFDVAAGGVLLPLPGFGLLHTSSDEPLSAAARERLAALRLDHLRVDLHLRQEDVAEQLRAGMAEAAAIGAPLHLALFVNAEEADVQLAALAALVAVQKPPVIRWLVFPTPELFLGGTPTAAVLATAHRHLDGLVPAAQFAAGTDTEFIFAQRSLPPLEQIDLFTFAMNPQVHAFDNLSLAETLGSQATSVQTARHLAQGKPVMVSPITLKMRYNPLAAEPAPPTPAGELPANVDVRQMSLFGAGWTLGSIKAMAESGVASATYYETVGWRGVMETAAGSAAPDTFFSLPDGVFPLYHIFAALSAFVGGQVLPARSSDPLRVTGLVLQKAGAQRLLLANLTPEPQQIALLGLRGVQQVWRLDENNAEQAMRDPASLVASAQPTAVGADGRLLLDLLPYAIAGVDSAGSGQPANKNP